MKVAAVLHEAGFFDLGLYLCGLEFFKKLTLSVMFPAVPTGVQGIERTVQNLCR